MSATTPLVSLVSGTVSSMVSMASVYPLDTILTRRQVQKSDNTLFAEFKKILENEGVGGLYSGLESSLVGVGITWAIFFYANEKLKELWAKKNVGQMPSVYTSLFLSMIAGVCSATISNPIWVANARQKVKRKTAGDGPQPNIFTELKTLCANEGLPGMFAGVGPALMLVVNPAIQFAVYERIKNSFLEKRRAELAAKKSKAAAELTVTEGFLLGAAAKLVSTVGTYPLQVVKVRMQVRKPKEGEKQENELEKFIKSTQEVYAERGLAGFFAGMETKLLATVLNSAIMFMLYERIVMYSKKLLQ